MEDFSDGDIHSAPAWQGDVDDFIVNNAGQLQLDADGPGTSFIYLPHSVVAPYQWSIQGSLLFNPSQSNKLRIYLVMDNPDPNSADGFYLELGENGNEDVWRLFRLESGLPTSIARGVTRFSEMPSLDLEITLTSNFQFRLKTIDATTSSKKLEFETNSHEPELSGVSYFGFQCIYTESRKQGFVFDNILAVMGTPSLTIGSIEVINANKIAVNLTAPVDRLVAEDPLIYKVQPGVGSPDQSLLSPTNKQLHLTFENEIQPLQRYTLFVEEIKDLNGEISSLEAQFQWTPEVNIAPYQIIINEILADPVPTVGLPEVEFIELHYPGIAGPAIDLQNLKMTNSGTALDIPSAMMLPGDYIIICREEDTEALGSYGKVIGMELFPALRNDGDDLALQTDEGTLIHRISYDRSWYHDPGKDDGGYSLEMINPFDPCTQKSNWTASNDLTGGTPGSSNSARNAELFSSFEILSIVPEDDLITVFFNKQILSFSHEQITVNGDGLFIDSISHLPLSDHLTIYLDVAPEPGDAFELRIDSVFDCLNQFPDQKVFEIVIPQLAMAGDIVINEILFNPVSGGSDYIEIVNLSDKHILLSDLFLSNTTRTGDVIKITSNHVFKPAEHLVLTPETSDVLNQYQVPNPHWLIQHEIPALNNDSGNITIYRSQIGEAVVIDAFDYKSSFHSPFLREERGVSLERIDPVGDSMNQDNWASASSLAGFGTPTGRNSQNRPSFQSADQFSLDPEVFSPDGDGVDDFMRLHYSLPHDGYFGSLYIYNVAGHLVTQPINNQSWNQSGIVRWDGQLDSGLRAPVGTYILRVELLTAEGDRIRWKDTCVLAGKL